MYKFEELAGGDELRVVLQTRAAREIRLASPNVLEVKSATNIFSVPLPYKVEDAIVVRQEKPFVVVNLRKWHRGEVCIHVISVVPYKL
jgi:hypothetical protein